MSTHLNPFKLEYNKKNKKRYLEIEKSGLQECGGHKTPKSRREKNAKLLTL